MPIAKPSKELLSKRAANKRKRKEAREHQQTLKKDKQALDESIQFCTGFPHDVAQITREYYYGSYIISIQIKGPGTDHTIRARTTTPTARILKSVLAVDSWMEPMVYSVDTTAFKLRDTHCVLVEDWFEFGIVPATIHITAEMS